VAHFAELNSDNVVTRVIVILNRDTALPDGTEVESIGAAFCQKLYGGTWKQTSYNGKIRKNYAGVGHTYDSSRDAFIPPKPFASWTLDETTCTWKPPVTYPSDSKMYKWNEDNKQWVELTL